MKHQRIVERIRARGYGRGDLIKLRANAVRLLATGDVDAQAVIDEIEQATPSDRYVVFMGFCPGADFENRMDIDWRRNENCTFIFHESEQQADRFSSIHVGDLVALKKRQQFGKTMQLYGHGRVTGIRYDKGNHRYLTMNWSDQEEVIEVPLMGCNSTVDIRTTEAVESEMPDSFYLWLREGRN